MRPNPHQFAVFAYVVREGSFTRASNRLGLSQSAVTQHVAKLEKQIGARLLHRGREGVALTRTGQEFYELADRLVTLDALIHEKIDGHASLEKGHLTVIANAPRPALGLIARFRKAYPAIQVRFTLFDWTEAMRLLRTRQVDVAIVTAPDRTGDCFQQRISTARYMLYMPSDHPLAMKAEVSLHDLMTETLLIPEEGSFTERKVNEALDREKIVLPHTMQTTTFPVMKEAILHGVGLGIFLENSAYPNEGVVDRPITEMREKFDTVLVVPADKSDLKVVRSFIGMVD
ncbi:LysR family transcriptional regulator [Thalassovita taeanensis]|uniref:DNA-binding transcriptional regulator, LysR family n=1 Tax=Thalassovita taeanensis TaxID=657014 RepID=A0A1H9HDG8_9RHOB|nr:LysR family transcriptional regulator [Thalassovita taeanensis]SEQ60423.1 DNA-binding transcriptional regulator, LysR family [Thalassovita taeanensis]